MSSMSCLERWGFDMNITQIILDTVDEFLATGIPSTWDINNGLCSDFARVVIEKMGGSTKELYDVEALNFATSSLHFTPDDDDYEPDIWDVRLLEKYWPACKPTHNLSWDDVNTNYELPSHVWIVYKGKHYDAECPEGVDNFFELPLIRREMEYISENKNTLGMGV